MADYGSFISAIPMAVLGALISATPMADYSSFISATPMADYSSIIQAIPVTDSSAVGGALFHADSKLDSLYVFLSPMEQHQALVRRDVWRDERNHYSDNGALIRRADGGHLARN